MKQKVDWHQHWTRKSPGFHEARVNTHLQQYFPLFDLQPGDRVFLPLCGKAHDIQWLAGQGMEVIGVELSEVAVKSFFDEFSLSYEVTEEENFRVYRCPNITLYQGDIMHMRPDHLDNCKLIYDRAAIVAIESFNRGIYAQHLMDLVPPATPLLMITLEYDQSVMTGPPFSVAVSEIEMHFAAAYRIEHLTTVEQIDERPRWRELGLESFRETALRLSPPKG